MILVAQYKPQASNVLTNAETCKFTSSMKHVKCDQWPYKNTTSSTSIGMKN